MPSKEKVDKLKVKRIEELPDDIDTVKKILETENGVIFTPLYTCDLKVTVDNLVHLAIATSMRCIAHAMFIISSTFKTNEDTTREIIRWLTDRVVNGIRDGIEESIKLTDKLIEMFDKVKNNDGEKLYYR